MHLDSVCLRRFLWLILGIFRATACLQGDGPGLASSSGGIPADPVAIAAVAAGERPIANARWWGFNPEDATDSLQAAIDSKAKKVIIPLMNSPWILRPIRLRSELEMEFEPGVLVMAKAGAFLGGGDSLFRAVDQTNLVIRGHSTVLRMRKSDYQKQPYPKAEWRMGLSLSGCRNVRIEGVRIEESGGDGFYVGSSPANRWCEDIVIRDCEAYGNHRQGLSVISAVRLLVERCVFSGTAGTAPEAGIDFEPDEPDERLVECVVRDCRIDNNAGNGLLVYLKPLTRESHPVSIRFENCHVRMGQPGQSPEDVARMDAQGWSGIAIGKCRDGGPQGLIEFIHCTSENTGREAVRLFDKSSTSTRVVFRHCTWKNSWTARHREYSGPRVPILVRCQESELCTSPGGVEFVECRVLDTLNSPVVRFEDDTQRAVLRELVGSIEVQNPNGGALWLGPSTESIRLNVTRAHP